MNIEMKRGEVIHRQHERFTGHAVIGAIVGAVIVAVLWSLT